MEASTRTVTRAYLQFISPPGEGLQLEICEADPQGNLARPNPLARILADDQEDHWFELYGPDGTMVRIPLVEIERAIVAARPDVHGEAWYGRPKD